MHIRNWTQLSSDCRNLDEPTWPMNQIRPDLWSGSKRVNGPGRTRFWTKRIQNSLVRHELKVGPTEPAWVGQSQSGPANQVNPTLLFQVSPLPVYGPNSMMTLDGMMTSLLMLFKKKKSQAGVQEKSGMHMVRESTWKSILTRASPLKACELVLRHVGAHVNLHLIPTCSYGARGCVLFIEKSKKL